MKGYITIVRRGQNDAYQAEVLGVPDCKATAATVDEALDAANKTLRRRATEMNTKGMALPQPRPSHDMIAEVSKRSAVAGACLRAPQLSA
jgi:hypothetical protein